MGSAAFHAYLAVCCAVSAFALMRLGLQYRNARRNRPAFNQADIRYEERFASGHSEASLMARLGGARNCLRLIVTEEYLIVTTRLPFALFSAPNDLEHVIPLRSISIVERWTDALSGDHLRLTYLDSQGHSHRLILIPDDPGRFLAAIGQKAIVMN